MMETLELAQTLHDGRFKTALGRLEHREELDTFVASAVAKDPAADWVDRLRTAGVPAALVRELPESIPSIETTRRGVTTMAAHAVIDEAPELGPVMRLKRRGLKPAEAAPLLGQDGVAVLKRWLGYGADDLAAVGIQDDAS